MRLLRWSLIALLFVVLGGLIWYGLNTLSLFQPTTPTLSLTAPTEPQPPTSPIDIEIAMTGANNLAGFEFELLYDPAFVTVTGITLTTFLGEPINCNPNATRCATELELVTQSQNMISIGGYSYGTGSGADGGGVLALLQFMPTGILGTTSLQINNAQLADANGNATVPLTQDAVLTIAEPTVTPTHTPTPTFTPTATHTATPTPTATHPNYTAYLPVVLKPATASQPTQSGGASTSLPRLVTNSPTTDVNSNGYTDIVDIELVAAAWGTTPGSPTWNPDYDFDGDNMITANDIAVVAADWRVPNIFSFDPSAAPPGSLITILGSNFNPVVGAGPIVELNRVGGGIYTPTLMTVTAGQIDFVATTEVATGPIMLTVGTHIITTQELLSIVPAGSFTITAGPNAVHVIQGQSVSYAISLIGVDFTQLAELEVSGYPTGTTTAFMPPYLTSGQTSVLSLTVPLSQPPITSTLHVTATANVSGITVTRSATLTLHVEPVSTAFLGRAVVADPQQTPLAGVTIIMLGRDGNGNPTGCTGQTISDIAGNFAFTNLPPECTGGQLIRYDGTTVTNLSGIYAGVDLFYQLAEGQVTVSPVLIHLPRIDDKETVLVQQNAPFDQQFTLQSIPNLTVTVYASTTFTLLDGSQPNPFPLIAIEVPVDRLPDTMPPMPDMIMPFIVAFQPANAVASQSVAVSFPNWTDETPGTTMELSTLDPTKGIMVMYGTGTVSTDGTKIIPDFDPTHPGHRYGLVHFDWHGPAPAPPPRVPPCPNCCKACSSCPLGGGPVGGGPGGPPTLFGKSIDVSSGLEIYSVTDISLSGGRGTVSIARTYRTLSNYPGPFGLGTNHNFGYWLDTLSPQTASIINLAMPDDSRYPFVRQADGTLINTTNPGLIGAILYTNGSAPFIRWKDGTVYRFILTNFQFRYVLDSFNDANGNIVTLVRMPGNPIRITEIIDTVGRKLRLNYDNSDRITSIADPVGRTVQYTYNSQGTLASVTDPDGNTTQYTYDGLNRLQSVVDARGVTIATNIYDDKGRVIEQIRADGGHYRFAYTLMNPIAPTSPVLQTIVTDPMGRQTTYRFNPQGFVTSVTDPLGQMRIYEREPGTNQLLSNTGTGSCEACGLPGVGDQHYIYDARGNLLSYTDALGHTTTYTYEPQYNKVASITDALGQTQTYAYDARGNLLSQTDANGHTTTFIYDLYGQLTGIVDPLGVQTSFVYDNVGNLVSSTDGLGNVTLFRYDGLSRLVETVDALNRHSLTTYDDLGRVIVQTDPYGDTTEFSYDPVGNLLAVTDALEHSTIFVYDSRNRLITRTTQLGYFETYTYDFNDNLTAFTDRRGITGQFTYDVRDRLVREAYPDGGQVTYLYDAYDRLVWVNDSEGGVFAYGYDLAGRTLSAASPFGTVSYEYDVLNRVLARQVTGTPLVQYAYDPAGNLLLAATQGVSITFAYDARDQLLTMARSNGVDTAYSYDPLGRVLSIIHASQTQTLNSQSYIYDAFGNRINHSNDIAQALITQPVTHQYDANNRLISSTTVSGTVAYTYDENGNLTSETGPNGTTTYTWDTRNRLATLATATGETISFRYDFAKNLIATTTMSGGTQRFVLDERTNVIYESDSEGNQHTILTGNTIDSHYALIKDNGVIEFALSDALNSTVATVDTSGTLIAQMTYEPYGQTSFFSGDYSFRYTGRVSVYDDLYYYRTRYYDSIIGRFISEDSIGFNSGDFNLYRYVNNNPVNDIDPMGMASCRQGCYKQFKSCLSSAWSSYTLCLKLTGYVCGPIAAVNPTAGATCAQAAGGACLDNLIKQSQLCGLRLALCLLKCKPEKPCPNWPDYA